MHKPSFIRSVKGKIIIAATLACFALFLAWSTSKDAFTGMLNAFEKVSAPNEKLRLVNDISRGIARLDQVQRARYIANPENNYASADSKDLVLKVDTLRSLYPAKSAQAERLESLRKLLEDRDRLFANYVKVREGLIDNKSFSAQVEGLNTVLDQTAQQADSMVTTTEKKTSTTTVYPTATITDKKDTRGFFTRLFGKKRAKDTIDSLSKPFQIVNEELAVKHDTLAKAIQDSLLKGLGQTMRDLEAMQQRKSAAFVNRESILIQSSSKIVKQIFSILKKVEGEVVAQTAENNAGAETMIHTSIKRISLIMLGFVILAVLLVYFILRDISRINKYRQEIELAKDEAEYHAAAKQRFLSNMSHEIRTPLQSIIGYAEILKQEQRPKRKDIEAIYNSSAHLMQIVNEVLDYNRIISGKFSFANEVFNMQALLNEVITIMHLQADKKGLALTTNYDESVSAFVTGDPFRLKQVLFNLLGNAIKFTQSGGVTLSVSVNESDEKLGFHFDVTDTGIGLTAAEIGRIFYEFEQAGDEKQARTGTGLGLAITRELIESQGGTMKVKSKPGKGSSFIFDMEYVKTDEPLEDTLEKRTFNIAGTGEKVWIIDDDPFILELCSRIFDINRIEYRCFTSPHEILAAADNTDVKCLLLDIRMPEMSGIELCNRLREKMSDDVMIYALTAQAVPGERETVLKAGFNGVLMKPFRESELLTLIKCAALKKDKNDTPVFDLTAIEKMTLGDSSQTAKILLRFAEDSTNDGNELRLSIKNNDFDKSLLLLHRIAGRTAQGGARELAEKFRLAEIELRENEGFDATLIVDINALCTQLEEIAAAARTYALNEEAPKPA